VPSVERQRGGIGGERRDFNDGGGQGGGWVKIKRHERTYCSSPTKNSYIMTTPKQVGKEKMKNKGRLRWGGVWLRGPKKVMVT